jgi:hypothetical protein
LIIRRSEQGFALPFYVKKEILLPNIEIVDNFIENKVGNCGELFNFTANIYM